MTTLGLDIGTTTCAAVVLDADTKTLIESRTCPGPGFLQKNSPFERTQSPEAIFSLAKALLDDFIARCHPCAIGLSGQMHGVVPLNGAGEAIGPLYTWQDGRAGESEGGVCVADELTQALGLPVASGYGLATAVWNARHGFDKGAVSLATIGAYVGLRLTGKGAPLLHASDAASLGGYDVKRYAFTDKARALCPFLPPSTPDFARLGEYRGIPVAVSLGDNQASVLGAAGGCDDAAVVNIGTGSQVSVIADTPLQGRFDLRPYIDRKYLLVNSALCGGRSYALFEKFVRDCAAICGLEPDKPVYDRLNAMAMDVKADGLICDTRFEGTREDPSRRGGFTGLSTANFTPAHMARAILEGMARELYEGYEAIEAAVGRAPARLIGSGNAIRLNPALRTIVSSLFGLPLRVADAVEEAATGAALFALKGIMEKL